MDTKILRIHYCRLLGDYDGWGLHVWGDSHEYVTWEKPLWPSGADDFGPFWDVRLQPEALNVWYVLHRGNHKDPGPDLLLTLEETGMEIWLAQGSRTPFRSERKALEAIKEAGQAEFRNHARAYWLDRFTIAWPHAFGPKAIYTLHYHRSGGLSLTPEGVSGGEGINLVFAGPRLDRELAARFPHLKHAAVLRLPPEVGHLVPEFLKGQVGIAARSDGGSMLAVTGLQLPGVLDDLYTYTGTLGVSFKKDRPTLRLWAPTAKQVSLHLFADSNPQTQAEIFPMNWEPTTGVWMLEGEESWDRQFYMYEVEVFDRHEGSVITNTVTDPYSLSLSVNSQRSQIVNLADPDLIPPGWEELKKPALASPTDIVLYELHVRDFSSADQTVPKDHRGGYLAFTYPDSNGGKHLRRLARAGLSHIHLLPVNDFGSIEEEKTRWLQPDFPSLAAFPPDSDKQQAALNRIRGQDGYNWGYDPLHYLVPEGSYASDPDGPARIRDFRSMVLALSQMGLRVVLDVVFNHTYGAGRQHNSILDRIVPEYYHRLDSEGWIVYSSCCPDTASENAMMEKLMIDAVMTWAREYKIDGFRFDLMGHHLVENMKRVQDALGSLTPGEDGTDGASLFLYGEGWDFGGLAGNARGPNATGRNLAGSGVGTFNDRFRDAARGGGPFQGLQEQGVITGLYLDPNETNQGPLGDQRLKLLDLKDLVRLSLAGNLADYPLENRLGTILLGSGFSYRGGPAAFSRSPQENIPYLEAHDNETLFDAIQYKAPINLPMAARVRMQNMGISLLALSQGVPFFHAGMEILRSKSLDRDSYDSGDWFNRLDFTYQDNNWGVGLPFFDKNGGNWPVMKGLLGRAGLKPTPNHIETALHHFEEMLAIRRNSSLFRLTTAQEVRAYLRFHNTGPNQDPALIVMSLGLEKIGEGANHPDPMVVLFNFGAAGVKFELEVPEIFWFQLHPILVSSFDPEVRKARFDSKTHVFSVPGRTTAVFIRPAQG